MAAITAVACTKSEEDVAMIIGLIGAILGEIHDDKKYELEGSDVCAFNLTLVWTVGGRRHV